MDARTAPPAGGSRFGVRRRLVAVAVLVVVLVAVLLAVRLTADERLQRWTASCEADGGSVETLQPVGSNPLVAESDDPTYRCRSADGAVLRTWR